MARWIYTDRRPPNHLEMIHKGYFSGDELELLPETLHQRIDALLDEVRAAVERSDVNVWRIGEIRIRWRAGRASDPNDIRSMSSGDEVLSDYAHPEDGMPVQTGPKDS